jgi:hypothetical protein
MSTKLTEQEWENIETFVKELRQLWRLWRKVRNNETMYMPVGFDKETKTDIYGDVKVVFTSNEEAKANYIFDNLPPTPVLEKLNRNVGMNGVLKWYSSLFPKEDLNVLNPKYLRFELMKRIYLRYRDIYSRPTSSSSEPRVEDAIEQDILDIFKDERQIQEPGVVKATSTTNIIDSDDVGQSKMSRFVENVLMYGPIPLLITVDQWCWLLTNIELCKKILCITYYNLWEKANLDAINGDLQNLFKNRNSKSREAIIARNNTRKRLSEALSELYQPNQFAEFNKNLTDSNSGLFASSSYGTRVRSLFNTKTEIYTGEYQLFVEEFGTIAKVFAFKTKSRTEINQIQLSDVVLDDFEIVNQDADVTNTEDLLGLTQHDIHTSLLTLKVPQVLQQLRIKAMDEKIEEWKTKDAVTFTRVISSKYDTTICDILHLFYYTFTTIQAVTPNDEENTHAKMFLQNLYLSFFEIYSNSSELDYDFIYQHFARGFQFVSTIATDVQLNWNDVVPKLFNEDFVRLLQSNAKDVPDDGHFLYAQPVDLSKLIPDTDNIDDNVDKLVDPFVLYTHLIYHYEWLAGEISNRNQSLWVLDEDGSVCSTFLNTLFDFNGTNIFEYTFHPVGRTDELDTWNGISCMVYHLEMIKRDIINKRQWDTAYTHIIFAILCALVTAIEEIYNFSFIRNANAKYKSDTDYTASSYIPLLNIAHGPHTLLYFPIYTRYVDDVTGSIHDEERTTAGMLEYISAYLGKLDTTDNRFLRLQTDLLFPKNTKKYVMNGVLAWSDEQYTIDHIINVLHGDSIDIIHFRSMQYGNVLGYYNMSQRLGKEVVSSYPENRRTKDQLTVNDYFFNRIITEGKLYFEIKNYTVPLEAAADEPKTKVDTQSSNAFITNQHHNLYLCVRNGLNDTDDFEVNDSIIRGTDDNGYGKLIEFIKEAYIRPAVTNSSRFKFYSTFTVENYLLLASIHRDASTLHGESIDNRKVYIRLKLDNAFVLEKNRELFLVDHTTWTYNGYTKYLNEIHFKFTVAPSYEYMKQFIKGFSFEKSYVSKSNPVCIRHAITMDDAHKKLSYWSGLHRNWTISTGPCKNKVDITQGHFKKVFVTYTNDRYKTVWTPLSHLPADIRLDSKYNQVYYGLMLDAKLGWPSSFIIIDPASRKTSTTFANVPQGFIKYLADIKTSDVGKEEMLGRFLDVEHNTYSKYVKPQKELYEMFKIERYIPDEDIGSFTHPYAVTPDAMDPTMFLTPVVQQPTYTKQTCTLLHTVLTGNYLEHDDFENETRAFLTKWEETREIVLPIVKAIVSDFEKDPSYNMIDFVIFSLEKVENKTFLQTVQLYSQTGESYAAVKLLWANFKNKVKTPLDTEAVKTEKQTPSVDTNPSEIYQAFRIDVIRTILAGYALNDLRFLELFLIDMMIKFVIFIKQNIQARDDYEFSVHFVSYVENFMLLPIQILYDPTVQHYALLHGKMSENEQNATDESFTQFITEYPKDDVDAYDLFTWLHKHVALASPIPSFKVNTIPSIPIDDTVKQNQVKFRIADDPVLDINQDTQLQGLGDTDAPIIAHFVPFIDFYKFLYDFVYLPKGPITITDVKVSLLAHFEYLKFNKEEKRAQLITQALKRYTTEMLEAFAKKMEKQSSVLFKSKDKQTQDRLYQLDLLLSHGVLYDKQFISASQNPSETILTDWAQSVLYQFFYYPEYIRDFGDEFFQPVKQLFDDGASSSSEPSTPASPVDDVDTPPVQSESSSSSSSNEPVMLTLVDDVDAPEKRRVRRFDYNSIVFDQAKADDEQEADTTVSETKMAPSMDYQIDLRLLMLSVASDLYHHESMVVQPLGNIHSIDEFAIGNDSHNTTKMRIARRVVLYNFMQKGYTIPELNLKVVFYDEDFYTLVTRILPYVNKDMNVLLSLLSFWNDMKNNDYTVVFIPVFSVVSDIQGTKPEFSHKNTTTLRTTEQYINDCLNDVMDVNYHKHRRENFNPVTVTLKSPTVDALGFGKQFKFTFNTSRVYFGIPLGLDAGQQTRFMNLVWSSGILPHNPTNKDGVELDVYTENVKKYFEDISKQRNSTFYQYRPKAKPRKSIKDDSAPYRILFWYPNVTSNQTSLLADMAALPLESESSVKRAKTTTPSSSSSTKKTPTKTSKKKQRVGLLIQ